MMQRLTSLDAFHPAAAGTIVSIGNFDGVHVAHQHVLKQVVARARATGGRSLVITFDPHPTRVLRPESAPQLITAIDDRLALIAACGVDSVVVVPFDQRFAQTTGEDFCRLLVERAKMREAHEGANFRFGRGAATDVLSMREIGARHGFDVIVYPEEHVRGETVSSSRIRQLISAGRLNLARHLLGRAHFIRSTPAPGRGYGRRSAVPTVNLARYDELLPANGVYVTQLEIAGREWKSITNIGNRPTFGADSFAVESHVLDAEFVEDAAPHIDESTPLKLTFLHRLRDERRWPDAAALKAQILRDAARARRWFALGCVDDEERG